MTIRIWTAFSCNNSSSYRLVARFVDAAAARDTELELRAFLAEHAAQLDLIAQEAFPDTTEAAEELARTYGFAWDDVLVWGDDVQAGDEPSVAATEEVLVVYHSYCNGFGTGIPAYLAARGAQVEPETTSSPSLSVLFAYAGGNAALDADLAMLFGQGTNDAREVSPLRTPWDSRWDGYGKVAWLRDAGTVGMYFPIAPTDVANLKGWLDEHGIVRASLRYGEDADEDKLLAIARARCTACHGPLVYWSPRIHDIHAEQLACTACGGMYDLAAFVGR